MRAELHIHEAHPVPSYLLFRLDPYRNHMISKSTIYPRIQVALVLIEKPVLSDLAKQPSSV